VASEVVLRVYHPPALKIYAGDCNANYINTWSCLTLDSLIYRLSFVSIFISFTFLKPPVLSISVSVVNFLA
jgi:hypothetical protein